MTQYAPTSSLNIVHEVHNKVDFTSIIDTPCLKTDRIATITSADKTTFTDALLKTELTSSQIEENCTIEKSTLLYYDTIRNVYIWKYEKQSILTTIPVFLYGYKITYDNILPCSGRSAGIRDYSSTGYLTLAGFTYTVTDDVIYCEEAIYAVTPKQVGKQTLVGTHAYTKPMFGSRAVGEVSYTYSKLDGYGRFRSTDTCPFDGGTDLFYPEWCRNMLEEPFWRKAADDRVKLYYSNNDIYTPNNLSTTIDWVPNNPIKVDPTQIGAIAYNSKEQFISSLIFYMHDGISHIVNDSSIEDVITLLRESGDTTSTTYYPLGLL